jgi:hypothetical protein
MNWRYRPWPYIANTPPTSESPPRSSRG